MWEYGKKISDRNLSNKQKKLDLLIHVYDFDLINTWQEYVPKCNIERHPYEKPVQQEERQKHNSIFGKEAME